MLRRAGRGYNASVVEQSAKLIRQSGMVLGVQLMPGLPGDTAEKSIFSARRVIELGASEIRLYPTVVLKDTPLAELWQRGDYTPMGVEAAVSLCATLKQMFEENHLRVLKVGLHSGAVEQDVLAGPFHPAFGQLVDSRICLEMMNSHCTKKQLKNTDLFVLPNCYDVSDILGQRRANVSALQTNFGISLKISKKVLTNAENFIIL